jgi:flagellar hook-length control protein FliK
MEQLQTQSLWTLVRLVRAERTQGQKPEVAGGEQIKMPQEASPIIAGAEQSDQAKKEPAPVTQVNGSDQLDQAVKELQAKAQEPADKQAMNVSFVQPRESGTLPLETASAKSSAQTERLVMTQTLDQIRIISRSGSQEIQMRLDPPDLGRMQMKLSMDGSSVSARVTVENETVKQVLQNGLPQLREAFSSQGLRVERFDINVGFGFDQQQQNKELRDRWNLRRGWTPKSNYDLAGVEALGPATQTGDTGKRYGYNTIELLG